MVTDEIQRPENLVGKDPGALWWLWLTVPIAVLATAASVIGIFVDDIHAKETSNWAAQGMGQDVGNLIAYPTLLVLVYLAARGSLRACLACIGVLVYSVYAFANLRLRRPLRPPVPCVRGRVRGVDLGSCRSAREPRRRPCGSRCSAGGRRFVQRRHC